MGGVHWSIWLEKVGAPTPLWMFRGKSATAGPCLARTRCTHHSRPPLHLHKSNYLSTPLTFLSTASANGVTTYAHMANYKTGELVIVKYGNGTQVARIIRRLHTGDYKICRFVPSNDHRGGSWRSTGVTLKSESIISALPDTDPRARAAREG